MKSAILIFTYLIYIIFWQSMAIGGTVWLIIAHSWSSWWILLAIFLAGSAFRPSDWRKLWIQE